jgi:hypothetical protein
MFIILIEMVVEYQLQDALLCMPVFSGMSFTETVVGFGSPDYMAFLLGFFMDVIFCIVERVYYDEIMGLIYGLVESIIQFCIGLTLKFTPKWIKNYMGIIEESAEDKEKKPKREVEGVAASGDDSESVEPIIGCYSGIVILL